MRKMASCSDIAEQNAERAIDMINQLKQRKTNETAALPAVAEGENFSSVSSASSLLSEKQSFIFPPSPDDLQQQEISGLIKQTMNSYTEQLMKLTEQIQIVKQQITNQAKTWKDKLRLYKIKTDKELLKQKQQHHSKIQILTNQLNKQIDLCTPTPVENIIQYESIFPENTDDTSSGEIPTQPNPITPTTPPPPPPIPTPHPIPTPRPIPRPRPSKTSRQAVRTSAARAEIPPPLESRPAPRPAGESTCPPPSNYNKVDCILLGDSIVKHIQGRQIKRRSGKYLKTCSFPGARTEKVADHADIELKYHQAKTAIIHAGCNDLFAKARADDIVDNIAYLGLELRDRGVKHVGISGLTPVDGMKWDILDFNHRLKCMCETYKFDYIDNTNIRLGSHVARDGTHLNFDGVDILTGNYASYLRNVELRHEE